MITPQIPRKRRPVGDVDIAAVDKLVQTKALPNITWQQAALCPCQAFATIGALSGATGETRPSCAACKATPGWIYHSSQNVFGVVQSMAANPERFAMYGTAAGGGIRITFPKEIRPGFMDRFTLLDRTLPVSGIYERKATVEALRYPIATRTYTAGDPADPATPVTATQSVLYCHATDAAGVIAAAPITLNSDFTIDAQGRVVWTLGDAKTPATSPPVGGWYTMSHFIRPVYVAKLFPHADRATQIQRKSKVAKIVDLPVLVDCWLEWMGGVV